jgi:hypothetical protein
MKEEENEVTEIYFGKNRYLMRNSFISTYAGWDDGTLQRGWTVKLYDAKQIHALPIMIFYSWWFLDPSGRQTQQGEREKLTIENPHSNAITLLLEILECGYWGNDDNLLYPIYRQIYESAGSEGWVVNRMTKAIWSAQKNAGYHAINNIWVP